jgi:hypothetical protein
MSGYDEFFFGPDYTPPPVDVKAEARKRLADATQYARLHAPEELAAWAREEARRDDAREAPACCPDNLAGLTCDCATHPTGVGK